MALSTQKFGPSCIRVSSNPLLEKTMAFRDAQFCSVQSPLRMYILELSYSLVLFNKILNGVNRSSLMEYWQDTFQIYLASSIKFYSIKMQTMMHHNDVNCQGVPGTIFFPSPPRLLLVGSIYVHQSSSLFINDTWAFQKTTYRRRNVLLRQQLPKCYLPISNQKLNKENTFLLLGYYDGLPFLPSLIDGAYDRAYVEIRKHLSL